MELNINNPNLPTNKELIELFELPNSDFIDPNELEGDIGFSVKRNIPQQVANKLGCKNKDKHITLIHLVLERKKQTESKIPIYIRTGLTYFKDNQYLISHEDILHTEYRPIEIISTNEYYIDLNTLFFYDKSDQIIKPIDILYAEYQKHLRPTKAIFRKFHVLLQSIVIRSSYNLIQLSKCIAYLISWNDKWLKKNPYTKETDTIIHIPDVIVFNGIKGDKNSLFWYCFIHLILYVINYYFLNFELDIYKTALQNNFLTVSYAIFSYICFSYILVKVMYDKIFNLVINFGFKLHYKFRAIFGL